MKKLLNNSFANVRKIVARATVFMLFFAVVSCETDTPLEGTKWRLVGIVDPRTGILRELEPKDCEKCFTITFETNRIFIARGIKFTFRVDMNNIPDSFRTIPWCGRIDPHLPYYYDGNWFCDNDCFRTAVRAVDSFFATPEKLRFNTYHRGNPREGLAWYTLFKRVDL